MKVQIKQAIEQEYKNDLQKLENVLPKEQEICRKLRDEKEQLQIRLEQTEATVNKSKKGSSVTTC